MSIAGRKVYPSLEDVAIVMDLDEHGVSRWAGPGPARRVVAPAARRGVSESAGWAPALV